MFASRIWTAARMSHHPLPPVCMSPLPPSPALLGVSVTVESYQYCVDDPAGHSIVAAMQVFWLQRSCRHGLQHQPCHDHDFGASGRSSSHALLSL